LVLLATGRKTEAVSALERVVQLAPREDATRLDLAVVLLSVGRAAEALKHLRPLHQRHPEDERALFYFGLALRESRQTTDGDAVLEQVVAKAGEFTARARALLETR